LLLGIAAIVAMLTACSSSGGDTSGGTSSNVSGSTSAAAALTGSPYVVYSTIPLSGPTGLTPGVKSGGEVAAAAINAAGGVNGHPIKFVACNNQGTPASSQACGQDAVKHKAVAVIESQDAFGGAITVTDKAGIPTIGNCVCSQPDALSPTSFPTTTGPTSQAAQGTVLAALGAKTISAAVFDGAAGDTIAANVQSGLKPFNLKLKDIVKIPTTAGDLSPYVAKLKEADGINLICAPSTTLQLLRDLKQVGYTGKIVTSTALVHPSDLAGLGPAAEGIYLVSGSLPSTDTSNAGVAAFLADNKQFGGSDAATDGYAVEAWATLKMLAEVMKGLPSVTPQTLTEALKSAGTLETKPVVPVDFGKQVAVFAPVREFTSLFYLLQAKDSKFTAVSPTPYDMQNPPKSIP
jgi:ABC-type branched-subunit amino acid transport system substrate-binding protein